MSDVVRLIRDVTNATTDKNRIQIVPYAKREHIPIQSGSAPKSRVPVRLSRRHPEKWREAVASPVS